MLNKVCEKITSYMLHNAPARNKVINYSKLKRSILISTLIFFNFKRIVLQTMVQIF